MATTTSDEVRVSRLARAVASPAGILIVVPVLVASWARAGRGGW